MAYRKEVRTISTEPPVRNRTGKRRPSRPQASTDHPRGHPHRGSPCEYGHPSLHRSPSAGRRGHRRCRSPASERRAQDPLVGGLAGRLGQIEVCGCLHIGQFPAPSGRAARAPGSRLSAIITDIPTAVADHHRVSSAVTTAAPPTFCTLLGSSPNDRNIQLPSGWRRDAAVAGRGRCGDRVGGVCRVRPSTRPGQLARRGRGRPGRCHSGQDGYEAVCGACGSLLDRLPSQANPFVAQEMTPEQLEIIRRYV